MNTQLLLLLILAHKIVMGSRFDVYFGHPPKKESGKVVWDVTEQKKHCEI